MSWNLENPLRMLVISAVILSCVISSCQSAAVSKRCFDSKRECGDLSRRGLCNGAKRSIAIVLACPLACGMCSPDTPDTVSMYEYGVVIDVGSSGTRTRAYQWPANKHPQDIPRSIAEISNKKDCRNECRKKVPFSDLVDDVDSVNEYVAEMIGYAKDFIPEDQWHKTPIYFMATAGMRYILEPRADDMMDRADSVFKDPSVNPFKYQTQNTRILSGEEEGAFEWITVNYLRGYFSTVDKPPQVGILEMGGASTQIAFVPEVSTLAGKFRVTVGGVHYPLYVHSYLNYGQSASLRWTAQTLAEDSNNVISDQGDIVYIINPCVLQGDSTLEKVDGITYNSTGSGDPEACQNIVKQHLYKVDPAFCHPAPCAIGPFYQPSVPEDMDFFAVAAFKYSPKVFGIRGGRGIISPQEIGDAAREFCSLGLEDAKAQESAYTGGSYKTSGNCMMGLYAEQLFTRSYGFPGDSQQIHVVSDIQGTDINWCIGALLYEGADD